MLAYLIKCFVVLLGLWLARHFHLIPWNDIVNLVIIVGVPLLIAAGAWFGGRRAATTPKLNAQEKTLDRVLTNCDPNGGHPGRR